MAAENISPVKMIMKMVKLIEKKVREEIVGHEQAMQFASSRGNTTVAVQHQGSAIALRRLLAWIEEKLPE